MSLFGRIVAAHRPVALVVNGERVTYTPIVNGELQAPIETAAILAVSSIEQSSSPGYFADIQVDPAVIATPVRGDLVTWADGIVYVVAKVARPDRYSMFILAIHRQDDPTDEV